MSLPKSHVMERLSLAYVQAVVAAAGAHYAAEDQPEYGIDCTIKQVRNLQDGHFTYTGFPLMCQVKATTTWIEEPTHITYDLDALAYNKLALFESKAAILVLFRLSKIEDEWLHCNENLLEIRNCCYWEFIQGPETSNTGTKRLRIPRTQLFDPQAVISLLEQLRINKGSLV